MPSSLERLTTINPDFKELNELHGVLNGSDSVERMDQIIEEKDWTLDVMQVLLPISTHMWELGLTTEEDDSFKQLATENLDLAFAKSFLTGDFGYQPYAWLLKLEIKGQVREGKRGQDNIPTTEELNDFTKNALAFALRSIRNFLFTE